MSRLTDRISYLQGLAEGMKLNPSKDSHKLIIGILEVLGEVGDAFEALADSHGELSDYVEAIDEDLADLEANLYDDENEGLAKAGNEDDFEDMIEYECPHCGAKIEIDPDEADFDEDALCPACGKELFPELPEEGLDGEAEDKAEEKTEVKAEDKAEGEDKAEAEPEKKK